MKCGEPEQVRQLCHYFLGQMRGQSVENRTPALAPALEPLRQNSFMRERQFASCWQGLEIDADARHLGRVLRHSEGEDKPARAVDFQIGAYMLDIIAVAARNVEGAANAG